MITRFNTNRDATRHFIVGSITILIILLIAPAALIATAQNAQDSTRVSFAYAFFYGSSFLLLFYCFYRYFHWNAHDDAYLLSGRTLAILSKGKPVRYVKPHDITGLKPQGTRLLFADGTPLELPRLLPEQKVTPLPDDIVTTWFGEESLKAIRAAYRDAIRPTTREITA